MNVVEWKALPIKIRVLAFAAMTSCLTGPVLMSVGIRSASGANEYSPLFFCGSSLLAIGVVGVIMVALVEYRRNPKQYRAVDWRKASRVESRPLPDSGAAWIYIAAVSVTRRKRRAWITVALVPCWVAVWVWQVTDVTLGVPLVRLLNVGYGSMAAFLVAVAAIDLFNAYRLAKRRIGVDSECVLYDSGNGKVHRYTPAEVLLDKARLLLGRRMLILGHGTEGTSLAAGFPAEMFNAYVLSRVPPTALVTAPQLLLTAIRRGNIQIWGGAIAIAGMLLFDRFNRYHPELKRAIMDAFVRWLKS